MRKLLISVSRTKISFHFKFHVLYKLLKYPYMLVYLIFLRFIFCLFGRQIYREEKQCFSSTGSLPNGHNITAKII